VSRVTSVSLAAVAELPRGHTRRIARWWDAISHHPLWATLIATVIGTLLAGAVIAHLGGVFGGGSPSGSHGTPLRAAVHQVSPGIYSVAFDHNVGLPSGPEQWGGLHRRGGIDAGQSELRLTLANRSDAPLTVNNIQAVVRHSRPRPAGALASVFTQGASAVQGLGILLNSDVPGAAAPLHRVPNGEAFADPADAPLFFPSHDIALAPGEIYEARLAVVTQLQKELEYGFVISGNTAQGSFSYTSPSLFRITGAHHGPNEYPHEYWRIESEHGAPGCWVLATNPEHLQHLPRCP
jgi:hypothetical protein